MKTIDAVTIFLTAKEAKGLSAQTLQSYQYRLHIFARLEPELPNTPEHIESFLLATGPSAETRDTYYRLLRNFYRFLIRRRFLSYSPVAEVEPIKLRRKIARLLTPFELSQLLQYPGHNRKVHAFLFLLADTGIRLSEALSVHGPENFRCDILTVSGKTGEREVPVSPIVKALVLQALPWPWSHWQTAGLAVRRAFRNANIQGRRASAHTLRHTFCRLWRGDETALVGIMGWTTPRMLTRYRPYNLDRARQQHQQFSPLKQALEAGQYQLALLT